MASPPIQAARKMRAALTPPEARLWVRLKALRKDGYAFRRQEPFRGYFLDFVCPSRRLAVEVDGQHHDFPDQMRRDRYRDDVLARDRFMTLRIRAIDIRDHIEGVMDRIRHELSRRPLTWDKTAHVFPAPNAVAVTRDGTRR